VAGLTLDSGALIGYQRRDRWLLTQLKAALLAGLDITVPAVVVAEVWRGGPRSARLASLLSSCLLEPIDESLARRAGEALARIPRAQTIDALVMASAAKRGDRVLTGDLDDLERLRRCFPKVRLVPV
jgi:predicted nucleic acid-binding protein